jgi:hypothetical protein
LLVVNGGVCNAWMTDYKRMQKKVEKGRFETHSLLLQDTLNFKEEKKRHCKKTRVLLTAPHHHPNSKSDTVDHIPAGLTTLSKDTIEMGTFCCRGSSGCCLNVLLVSVAVGNASGSVVTGT